MPAPIAKIALPNHMKGAYHPTTVIVAPMTIDDCLDVEGQVEDMSVVISSCDKKVIERTHV